MNGVLVKAPAKLNLTLNILGRLENGYHEMDMIMQTVDLYEKIIITKKTGISVRCIGNDGEPMDGIPTDRHNTAFKAAMLFFEIADIAGGAEISITKTVPVKAGMGGASADAAGVLAGLNYLYGSPLSEKRLMQAAAEVGADVPFALCGGTARVTGIGEKIERLTDIPDCRFVVVMPPVGVSTAEGFAMYDKIGGDGGVDTENAVKQLEEKNLIGFAKYQKNVMQKSCAVPQTDYYCDLLKENGACAALMTGSGAAVYGVFENELAAQAAAALIKKENENVYIVKPCSHGAFIENSF